MFVLPSSALLRPCCSSKKISVLVSAVLPLAPVPFLYSRSVPLFLPSSRFLDPCGLYFAFLAVLPSCLLFPCLFRSCFCSLNTLFSNSLNTKYFNSFFLFITLTNLYNSLIYNNLNDCLIVFVCCCFVLFVLIHWWQVVGFQCIRGRGVRSKEQFVRSKPRRVPFSV